MAVLTVEWGAFFQEGDAHAVHCAKLKEGESKIQNAINGLRSNQFLFTVKL